MTITEDQLKAVGRVTVNFAQLEFLTSAFLVGLIGPKQDNGWIVVSQLSFRRVINAIDSLMRENCPDEELRSECAEFVKRANACEEERNRLVHSSWMVGADGQASSVSRMKITSSRGLKVHSHSADAAEINKIGDLIRHVARDFETFVAKCVKVDAKLRGAG